MAENPSAGDRAFALKAVEQGTGRVERATGRIHLRRPSTTDSEYANAEVCDPDGASGWKPPVTMIVRARFSHPVDRLRGTAGFGFWNAALGPGVKVIRPPRALWFFFGGPPFDVPLAIGVPGHGFKAAVLDAGQWPFFALLPAAPLGFLLMRVPALYRRLWPLAQRAIGASEASLDDLDLTVPHTYVLRWRPTGATFSVDNRTVLATPSAPSGPLRFVAWIDNSYAIATPQGRFGLGLVAEPEAQWLDLERVEITHEA
jgi:hypothetical protein